jgi:hypothetical protein
VLVQCKENRLKFITEPEAEVSDIAIMPSADEVRGHELQSLEVTASNKVSLLPGLHAAALGKTTSVSVP